MWNQFKVVADGELMIQHYAAASAEELGKLWTSSSTMSIRATAVVTPSPRMSLIPMNCLKFLTEKPRTPFEFNEFVCKLATDDSTVDEVEWDFVKEWAICAAQTKSNNTETSCLSLDMENGATVFEGLQQFLRNRIQMTMLGHKIASPLQQEAQPAAITATAVKGFNVDMHPKIAAMMISYLEKFGRVQMKILWKRRV